MNYKKIEKAIADKVELLLKEFGFRLYSIDLEREHSVDFILNKDGLHYIFGIRFLHYSKTLGIEPTVLVSYDQVTNVVKEVIHWESKYFHGWLAISARVGDLINVKNKDGFHNDNDCPQIDFEPTEDGIQKAIAKLMKKYFKEGALSFIEKTDTLEKADHLVNEWVLKSNDRLRWLVYFGHKPWQITTGIILAKLVNRANYDQLLERFLSYAKDLDPEEYEWIKDFYSFVEHFKKNSIA